MKRKRDLQINGKGENERERRDLEGVERVVRTRTVGGKKKGRGGGD